MMASPMSPSEDYSAPIDSSLPPPPPHNLHSSYSMPSFSGTLPHRPYLNPIAASARTSHTRVDEVDDEEEQSQQHQEGEGAVSQERDSSSHTVEHQEKEKEKENEQEVKDKKEEQDSASSAANAKSQPVVEPQSAAPPATPTVPQTHLTFLLISGRRRTMAFEPETTVGRVKELMWNTWPDDWQDERPPAPAYLRVLYLGKMLQDDDTLTKLKLPVHTPTPDGPAPIPTIVHISIRPSPPPGENESVKKPRVRVRWSNTDPALPTGEDANAGGCCGCVIC